MSTNFRASKKGLSIGGRKSSGITDKITAFEEQGVLYYICPDCEQKMSVRANKADILRTFGELLHICRCKKSNSTNHSINDKQLKKSYKLLIKFNLK